MTGVTQLALRPAVVREDFEADMESEWMGTPSEDTFADENEVQVDPYGDLILRPSISGLLECPEKSIAILETDFG
ncbi:hypothetical protein COL922a_007136 [Colletotrichum nupharicola]|nr:hypothetical protein COL922a_007136 [Colletotrichum nupharicola]